jgi:hypothetical protein
VLKMLVWLLVVTRTGLVDNEVDGLCCCSVITIGGGEHDTERIGSDDRNGAGKRCVGVSTWHYSWSGRCTERHRHNYDGPIIREGNALDHFRVIESYLIAPRNLLNFSAVATLLLGIF